MIIGMFASGKMFFKPIFFSMSERTYSDPIGVVIVSPSGARRCLASSWLNIWFGTDVWIIWIILFVSRSKLPLTVQRWKDDGPSPIIKSANHNHNSNPKWERWMTQMPLTYFIFGSDWRQDVCLEGVQEVFLRSFSALSHPFLKHSESTHRTKIPHHIVAAQNTRVEHQIKSNFEESSS